MRKIRKHGEDGRHYKHDLGERVKELACLYYISDITERRDTSLAEMLQAVVEILPPSWQYPEITCGRIVFEDHEYTTTNFKETKWRISGDIVLDGECRGAVEVFYLEKRPESAEGPFLKEERQLADDIAIRLSRVIEQRRHDEMLRLSEERYRNLVEGLADSVVILEEGTITYTNAAMVSIIGAKDKDDVVGRDFLKIIHPDSRDHWLVSVVEQDGSWNEFPHTEIKMIRFDDQKIVEVEVSTTKTNLGDEVQYQLVLRDIRKRKQAEARKLYERLSKRERQILEMVAQGETSKIIAASLDISRRTVESHRANLIKKMESHSLADLIRKARVLGII